MWSSGGGAAGGRPGSGSDEGELTSDEGSRVAGEEGPASHGAASAASAGRVTWARAGIAAEDPAMGWDDDGVGGSDVLADRRVPSVQVAAPGLAGVQAQQRSLMSVLHAAADKVPARGGAAPVASDPSVDSQAGTLGRSLGRGGPDRSSSSSAASAAPAPSRSPSSSSSSSSASPAPCVEPAAPPVAAASAPPVRRAPSGRDGPFGIIARAAAAAVSEALASGGGALLGRPGARVLLGAGTAPGARQHAPAGDGPGTEEPRAASGAGAERVSDWEMDTGSELNTTSPPTSSFTPSTGESVGATGAFTPAEVTLLSRMTIPMIGLGSGPRAGLASLVGGSGTPWSAVSQPTVVLMSQRLFGDGLAGPSQLSAAAPAASPGALLPAPFAAPDLCDAPVADDDDDVPGDAAPNSSERLRRPRRSEPHRPRRRDSQRNADRNRDDVVDLDDGVSPPGAAAAQLEVAAALPPRGPSSVVARAHSPRFQCDRCGAGFSYRFSLTRHEMRHTGARPFQCELCPRAFRQRVTLQTHMLTHTDNADEYECVICNASFRHRSSAIRHVRKTHKDDPMYNEVAKHLRSAHRPPHP